MGMALWVRRVLGLGGMTVRSLGDVSLLILIVGRVLGLGGTTVRSHGDVSLLIFIVVSLCPCLVGVDAVFIVFVVFIDFARERLVVGFLAEQLLALSLVLGGLLAMLVVVVVIGEFDLAVLFRQNGCCHVVLHLAPPGCHSKNGTPCAMRGWSPSSAMRSTVSVTPSSMGNGSHCCLESFIPVTNERKKCPPWALPVGVIAMAPVDRVLMVLAVLPFSSKTWAQEPNSIFMLL
jgi:hypothetical protein